MNKRILLISLGCDKNLVDSEMMLGQLAGKGYTFTDDEDEAEIAVVNSCCFINDAKEESINTILQLAERKKEGQLKALIVCGCLAQRYADEMQAEIPEVDAIVGTTAFDSISQAVEEVMEGCPHNHLEDINRDCIYGLPRSVTTGGHYAYLKIAEGCNKRCTYCVIPSVRGNYRSVPMESLVREARTLVAGGAKELILVAQETTIYGVDLYGEKMLPGNLIIVWRLNSRSIFVLMASFAPSTPNRNPSGTITAALPSRLRRYIMSTIKRSAVSLERMSIGKFPLTLASVLPPYGGFIAMTSTLSDSLKSLILVASESQ